MRNFSSEQEKREYYRRLGQKGGRANVIKNGREHMARIGRIGHQVTTKRHFEGSRALHGSWLSECGLYHIVKQTGLRMKYDRDGKPIWPATEPTHPAHSDEPWF